MFFSARGTRARSFLILLLPWVLLSFFFTALPFVLRLRESSEGFNPFVDPLLALLVFQAFFALFIFPFFLFGGKSREKGMAGSLRDEGLRTLSLSFFFLIFVLPVFKFSSFSLPSAMRGSLLIVLLYFFVFLVVALFGENRVYLAVTLAVSLAFPLADYGVREFSGKTFFLPSQLSPFFILIKLSVEEGKEPFSNFLIFLASASLLCGLLKVLLPIERLRRGVILFPFLLFPGVKEAEGDEVRSFYDGNFREGEIFPLILSGEGGRVEVTQGEEYALETLSFPGRFFLYPFIVKEYPDLHVRIRDQEASLTFPLRRIPRGKHVLAFCGQEWKGLLEEEPPGTVLLAVSHMPPRWEALEMIDVLAVSSGGEETLGRVECQAIAAWVGGGGTLVHIPGEGGGPEGLRGAIFNGGLEKVGLREEKRFGLGKAILYPHREAFRKEAAALLQDLRREKKTVKALFDDSSFLSSLAPSGSFVPGPLSLFFIGILMVIFLLLGLRSLGVIQRSTLFLIFLSLVLLWGVWMLNFWAKAKVHASHLPVFLGRLGGDVFRRIDFYSFEPFGREEVLRVAFPGRSVVKEPGVGRASPKGLIRITEGEKTEVLLRWKTVEKRCLTVEKMERLGRVHALRAGPEIRIRNDLGIALSGGMFWSPHGVREVGNIPRGAEGSVPGPAERVSAKKKGEELFNSGSGSWKAAGALLRGEGLRGEREVFLATGEVVSERGFSCDAIVTRDNPPLFLFFSE